MILAAVTITSILTQITEMLTFVFTVFSNLFDAITSNPWLLFSILIGFSSSAIALVIKIVKRVRKI